MPADTDAITLALVLTAAGATVTSALVTGVVQVLKQLLGDFMSGKEKVAAFVIGGILVAVAYAAGVQDETITISIPTLFAAVVAWYGISRLSMAVYDDASGTATPSSLRSD